MAGGRRPLRQGQSSRPPSIRTNRYQLPEGAVFEYKNINLLQKFVTDRGKIVSRRLSGVSSKQQRELVVAINRARFLGLLTMGVRKK